MNGDDSDDHKPQQPGAVPATPSENAPEGAETAAKKAAPKKPASRRKTPKSANAKTGAAKAAARKTGAGKKPAAPKAEVKAANGGASAPYEMESQTMSNESASAEHSNPPGNTDKLDYLWRFIGLVVFYWVAGFVLFVFAILSFGKFCDDLFCDGQHDGFNQALFEVRKYLGQITHYLMTGKDLPFPLGPWPKDDDLGPTP